MPLMPQFLTGLCLSSKDNITVVTEAEVINHNLFGEVFDLKFINGISRLDYMTMLYFNLYK